MKRAKYLSFNYMQSTQEKLLNEKELIIRSKQGDAAAFGELYDHYIHPLYNFIYFKTHHKETAEDITSQTFFKALKSIQSMDPEKSFKSWLYKIAQNTVIDHYRTRKDHKDIDDEWDIADEDVDIVGELDTARQVVHLKKYLAKLSPEERDIIIMRVWQELPYKEIAEIVGKSEASCKMSYSRSLDKLRALMPIALFFLLMLKR